MSKAHPWFFNCFSFSKNNFLCFNFRFLIQVIATKHKSKKVNNYILWFLYFVIFISGLLNLQSNDAKVQSIKSKKNNMS